jgi:hypothetical protein
MKKKFVGLLVFVLIVITALAIYKNWQSKQFGLVNPELETIISVSKFKSSLNLPGLLVCAKNKNDFEYLNQFFKPGDIWVFDGNGKIQDVNFENIGGSCYSDVIKNIENNFNFSEVNIDSEFASKNYLDSLLEKTKFQNDSVAIDKKNYDYIIVYSWAKYLKASYDNNDLVKQLGRLTKDKKRILVISVNMDYIDYIFESKDELPRFVK